MNAFLTDLAVNLRQGLRAMLLRRVALGELRLSPDQLVALILLILAARTAVAVAVNGLDGFFNTYALTAEVTVIGTLLLAAFVTAKLTAEPRLLLGLPIAVLAIDLWFLLLQVPVRLAVDNISWVSSPPVEWGLHVGLIAWFLLASLVALLRFAPGRAARSSAGYAVYLMFYLGSYWVLPPQDLWLARTTEPSSAEWQITVADEEVLHAQPALLESTLAALRPQRPGVPDIYFVGFAGYSREDVFMNEVEVIGELFRERFDAAGRVVQLINHARTAAVVPYATATSLGRVLRHVGSLMNLEEDVLVLYLTSHGTEKHRLSVVNGPLTLQDIDPAMLARMLEDSGIKWRVLAVSACYAGGFIALKSETTLIMTAADARSRSFGCGAESDFTYFGKAVFDEEMRETHSFLDAFERARKTIAEREAAGKHRPSNPQIFVGGAIAGKLRELESRLQALPPAGGLILEEER